LTLQGIGCISGSATYVYRCVSGFAHGRWSVAGITNHDSRFTCVTAEARDRTAGENAAAPSLRDPGGAYGPNTCIAGYVWREAFAGDVVCVTPEIRSLVRQENRDAASHRVPR
jgi:hypothetical protein